MNYTSESNVRIPLKESEREFSHLLYKNYPYFHTKPKELIKLMYDSEEPAVIKNIALYLFQNYSDAMIERSSSLFSKVNQKQIQTYNSLYDITSKAVLNFYNNSDPSIPFIINQNENNENIEDIKEKLSSIDLIIANTNSKNGIKDINLLGYEDSIKESFDNAYKYIKSHNLTFDTIIPILSGGLEYSILFSEKFTDANLLPLRYSKHARNDDRIQSPLKEDIADKIKNKKILLIDDVICSGKTLDKFYEQLPKLNPKEIYFTIAWKSESSKVKRSEALIPDYLFKFIK